MSLFANEQYRWRETYFVLFEARNRPDLAAVQKALRRPRGRYTLKDAQCDAEGRFESLTLISPYDFAAMDISYVEGEEVIAQAEELMAEIKGASTTREELAKLERLPRCNARFDVYHFEQVVDGESDDDFLDPGALLIVLEQLARLCDGVSIDPQSGAMM